MAILNWFGDKAIENMSRAKSVALKASALIVEGQAKLLCPVDTGNLRNSITNEVEDQVARIGTNVEYGPHVELGTVKQTAQPFNGPALDRNKKNIQKIFAQTIGEVMGEK